MNRQHPNGIDTRSWLRLLLTYWHQLPEWAILLLAGTFLSLGLWAALAWRPSGNIVGLEVQRPSPITIQAPQGVQFESEVRTRQRIAEATSDPNTLQYTTDFALPRKQRAAMRDLFENISRVRNDPTFNKREKEQRILALSSSTVVLSDTLATSIVDLEQSQWESVRQETFTLYDQVLGQYKYQIDDRALQETNHLVPYWTEGMPSPQDELVTFFVTSFLRINHTIDQEATEQRKLEAAAAVTPVPVTVQAGETIVRAGEIVNQEMMEKLQETGALPKPLRWVQMLGLGMLSILMATLFLTYLVILQYILVDHPRRLMILIGLIIITVFSARFLAPLWGEHTYAFPMATTILIIAAVFNVPLALASALLLSSVIGMLDLNSLPLAVTMFLSSVVAIFTLRNAERVVMFFVAGVGVSIVIFVTNIAFELVMKVAITGNAVTTMLIFSSINGSLSAVLALGSFNLVARASGVITTLKLMELAHPAQPILRKLMREAPGTHFHSVSVGNLAESAAEAIGADALLLRVAAYYHDIGKTIRPMFFTDNQTGRENVHNDLDPYTSADIILDHVREGVKMAEEAGLPQEIVDFIATHHGTQEVSFFYQMAIRQHDNVNIEDFRYPGPKPFTREQAIMMLADSVEATIRSKAQHGKLVVRQGIDGQPMDSVAAIDALVGSIIDDRLHSGQLDDAPLTMHDLKRIRQAFVTTLKGIYHPRVEYPTEIRRPV